LNNKNKEWLQGDKKEINYHLEQYKNPKEYSTYLITLIEKLGIIKTNYNIIDLGCGAGANLFFLAKKYPSSKFYGLDINPFYIKIAKSKSLKNQEFKVADITKLNKLKLKPDLILSIQTLSWMPDIKKPLKEILSMNSKFVLITSLFYDGPVETKIKIKDFSRNMGEINYRESFYNIYSISRLKEFIKKYNYDIFFMEPFEIGIDLPKPLEKGMGTYTIKVENHQRLQVSGPLLMPWYTIVLMKKNMEIDKNE